MKKLEFIKRANANTLVLPNGKMLDKWEIGTSSKINLETEEYITYGEDGYKDSTLATIQNLIKIGVIKEVSCVKEIDYYVEKAELTNEDFINIKLELQQKGFNVSIKGLKHNYNAWKNDYKSGYRCEKSHIFTPCGCNKLRFTVSTLHRLCKDWQITYIA